MLFLTGLQLKSHFIRLSSLFLLFIPLIVRTEGQQRKEGMDVPLDESWGTWARRHVNHVFTDGPDIVVDEHSYVDDPPDPNEGWKQWAKRQACLKAKIECCIPPYVRRNTFISNLQGALEKEFFGQHLAAEIILDSIAAHWNGEPRRPLVLSFHGWAGSGKTYLAQHIAKALFRNGEKSHYYKHFTQGYDFHGKSEHHFPSQREKLQNELLATARKCEYALFVFDEVDGIAPGILDALTPFVDHPGIVGGVSFRKTIFILLNNVGASTINQASFEAWKAGRSRESLTIHDFESIITHKAFNEKESGLFRSKLIDKNLIDYSIPFLPMEKKHVKLCVAHESQLQGVRGLDPEEIASKLEYWPKETPLFSNSGCKKIEKGVAAWKAKHSPPPPVTPRADL